MSKLKTAFISVFFFSINAQAQQISGLLKDKTTNQPVANAVVMLLQSRDSVLYKYSRTNKNGSFNITNVKSGSYLFITTHPVFGDYTDSIQINESRDLGTLDLIPKATLLQEVIVKSGSPIRIKGDTVVYTADSFKVREGANVEELLRKLPGIQVGADGKVKAMGETANLLVDGEEFFGNDPGLIMKNLQASAVQEVQVYDKKSDQASFTGIDDGQTQKTINLKLKANRKRGYFGKLEAAGGTPDNYNNSAMFNAFMGKRKFSAFGIMSNTGKTQLGWDESERFGGGEMEGVTSGVDELSGGTWMSWNGNDGYYNGENGIPRNWNGGLHYSNKYRGDSLSINGSYRYTKVNAPGGSNTYSQVFLPDSNWSANSQSTMFNTRQRHSMSFTIESKIDSNNTIKFTNRGGINDNTGFTRFYEENLTTQKTFINNSSRRTQTESDGLTYNGTLTWNHKFKKARRTLSVSATADINDNKSVASLYSFNEFYKGNALFQKDTIDQQTRTEAFSQNYSSTLAYTEPLDKYLSLGINLTVNAAQSENSRNVFTQDANGKYNLRTDSLSNAFDFSRQLYRPGFVLRLVKKKLTAMVGTSLGLNRFIQKNLSTGFTQDYTFNNLFPTAGFRLMLPNNKRVSINYNGSAQAPTLAQLQPVPDNSNPLSIYVGNSNLSQSFTHRVSGNVSWSKPLADNSVWSSFSFSTTQNAFAQFNKIDSLGRTVYQTVNIDGNYFLNGYVDYSFALGKGKKKVNLSVNADADLSRNNDFVNGLRNTTKTKSYTLRLSVNKYKEKKFDFYVGPSLNYNESRSSINPESNTSFWGLNGWGRVNIYFGDKTELNVDGNFNFRERNERFAANNNFTRINASVKQFIYKKEISLRFSVNDLLNQNRGYSNNFSSYRFTESYFNTLRRFWLLSLTWDFNHQKKTTEAKK